MRGELRNDKEMAQENKRVDKRLPQRKFKYNKRKLEVINRHFSQK